MSNLHDDELQLERLKLKLAINKYLKKWGKQYAVTLKQQLRCDKPELFNQIVDELAEEGMLVKETGRNGGLILARIAVENSTTGAFGSALEKAEHAS
jgi:hypothetical protein